MLSDAVEFNIREVLIVKASIKAMRDKIVPFMTVGV